MQLTILGCGTLCPDPARACAGYALSCGSTNLLLDFGPGCYKRAAEAGLPILDIDALALTHFHADHCSDVAILLAAMNYATYEPRTKPLVVIGPVGVRKHIFTLFELYDGTWPLQYEIQFVESQEPAAEIGSVKVESLAMDHGSQKVVGYRVHCEGTTIAYTGDTAPCENLVRLLDQADLAIIECSKADGYPLGGAHLSATDVGKAASTADARSVCLVHHYPAGTIDECVAHVKAHYDGHVIVGADLMQIQS